MAQDSITLLAVCSQAKLILLGVVIAAILYVLISPLPELAAVSTLNLPDFALVLLLMLGIGSTLEIPLFTWHEQIVCFSEHHSTLELTCVRLC